MVELMSHFPGTERLPLRSAGVTLTARQQSALWAVAPYQGAGAALDLELAALGLRFPAPGRLGAAEGIRLAWAGRGLAFWIGAAPPPEGLAAHAALTDISDGWTHLRLEGRGAAEVLSRLVPVDLGPEAFGRGATARSLLGHMPALFLRAAGGIEVLVMRSMTETAIDEIGHALAARAARLELSG